MPFLQQLAYLAGRDVPLRHFLQNLQNVVANLLLLLRKMAQDALELFLILYVVVEDYIVIFILFL